MSGAFLLDGDADPERGMIVIAERGEALAQTARPGKQVDNAERGRQVSLPMNLRAFAYTRFVTKGQAAE
jgi:hypothetical protein